MSKTVAIPDRTHILIVKKQLEFREKYSINLKISEIISLLVEYNIDTLKDIIRDTILQKDISENGNIPDNNISETKNGEQNSVQNSIIT